MLSKEENQKTTKSVLNGNGPTAEKFRKSFGAILIINLALLWLILAFGSLLVDLPRALRIKRLLQLQCDAAAIAGAVQLLPSNNDDDKKLGWMRAKTVALKYLEDNPISTLGGPLENPTDNSNPNLNIFAGPTPAIPNNICKPDATVNFNSKTFQCQPEIIYKFNDGGFSYNVKIVRGIQYRNDPGLPGFNPNKDKGLRFAPIDVDNVSDVVTVNPALGEVTCPYGANSYCTNVGDNKRVWEVADSIQITVSTEMRLTLARLLGNLPLRKTITATSTARTEIN